MTISYTNFYGSAFFGGGFFGPGVESDTHDGGKKPWHQRIEKKWIDAKVKEYRSEREKLREDIIFAMDGPIEGEVLDVIRSELEPEDYAQFGAEDYEPQLKSLLSQTEALRKIAILVMEERMMQDEEDAEFLLLN